MNLNYVKRFLCLLPLLILWSCNNKSYRILDDIYEMTNVEDGHFSDELARAVDFCKRRGLRTVKLPPGTHTVKTTFLLPDNFTFLGEGRTVLKATLVNTAKGGYPITIFDCPEKGVENVRVQGIIFDGNGVGRRKNLSQTEGSANTLRLRNSRNITFVDCELRNHFSNIPAPYSAANFTEARSCVGLSVEGCKNIVLKDFRLQQMPNEALWFYDSENVAIDNMVSTNHTQLSSHLTFWYCDTVSVENSYFSYDRGGGSALNIESSNVRIANNEFVNGRGIDISNEANFEDFSPSNVSILGNKLTNVQYYGIMRNRSKRSLLNFIVEGNQIAVDGTTGKKTGVKVMAIKTDDTERALVRNNKIEFLNPQPGNDYIAFASFGYNENGTTIQGNTIVGADYLYWGSTYVGSKTNSTISGNDCKLRPKKGRPGAIYVYNKPRAKAGNALNGFRIENNMISGSNSERLLSITSEVGVNVSDLFVVGNQSENGNVSVELVGQKISLSGEIEMKSLAGKTTPTLFLEKVNLQEVVIKRLQRNAKIVKRN